MNKYIDAIPIIEKLKSRIENPTTAFINSVLIGLLEKAPTANVVSREVFEQVKWERNMALQTLQEHGIGLGEKTDVVKVVRCKECQHCIVNKNHPDKPLICTMTKMCGTTSPEWHCAAGKRKEGTDK